MRKVVTKACNRQVCIVIEQLTYVVEDGVLCALARALPHPAFHPQQKKPVKRIVVSHIRLGLFGVWRVTCDVASDVTHLQSDDDTLVLPQRLLRQLDHLGHLHAHSQATNSQVYPWALRALLYLSIRISISMCSAA